MESQQGSRGGAVLHGHNQARSTHTPAAIGPERTKAGGGEERPQHPQPSHCRRRPAGEAGAGGNLHQEPTCPQANPK